jgi:hypothetical protein
VFLSFLERERDRTVIVIGDGDFVNVSDRDLVQYDRFRPFTVSDRSPFLSVPDRSPFLSVPDRSPFLSVPDRSPFLTVHRS